jgi:glycosidase
VISGATSAKVGATKTFNGSASEYLGGTISSYTWSVTGGATLSSTTGESVNITFPSSETTVNVTLTIKTSDNKTAAAEQNVRVTKVSDKTDFREETIYFLMTTRFFDGDTSNNEYCWDEGGEYLPYGAGDCAWRGDFKGLADKLDYIKALGFSAIWITPVVQNSSGIDYHGYHAYDFKTVDPRYESADFKYQDLIEAAHNKGIKVIQDIVLNHTGNFGEKNIFGMFKKDTVPYVNKDYPLPSGAQWNRSPFYSVDPNGYAYSKLMAGLAMQGKGNTIDAYNNAIGGVQYGARINAMKEDSIDTDLRYHHAKMIDWNSENCQLGQMAGDCVDLNTENPTVFEYLKEAYCDYINMGVDAFRIDTVKHISRLTFNKEFIPAFMEAGGDNFYIFGETCARYRGRWNEGVPALSPAFYTWKEDRDFAWSKTDAAANSASATAHFGTYRGDYAHPAWADGTANHLLKNGRTYHEPDYSKRSHLDQIDFPMHWAFRDAGEAFNTAVNCNDPDFNDATWNVTYVDSHDYAPDNAPENKRFNGYWPDKMNLLWTFRGIPCIYYGSEIEFMKGCGIDPASERIQLNKSGRAYFGDHIEGSVKVSGYGEYSNASGAMAETLNHPLAQHVRRLNLIRRAVRALQKGQYSVEGCSGGISFKRGYKNPGDSEFSFACVAINGGATFTNLPGGTYTEVITGAKKTVSDGGSITSDSIGEGNMRVYVLQSDVTGKIGEAGTYLK